MKLYAIKHLPTGTYMPQPMGRGGRGGTNIDLIDFRDGMPPRLFVSEGSAKAALTWWLKGRTTVFLTFDDMGEGDENWRTDPVAERKKEDMAVVAMKLKELNQ